MMISLLALATFAISQDTAHTSTVAIYATRAPIIDGRDNDPVWREATPITDFTLNYGRNVNDYQWYGFYDDALGPHYTFARWNQTTTSGTVRMNYTFTPTVSLQAYVQPFVSKGTYTNVRQLSSTPRAANYDQRFAPFLDASVTSDPGGFNFKQFQSNVVFRWEYRPGSTLFVVWNEGRQGFANEEGVATFSGDIRNLMALHPANTFLVKMSYWLNR